MKKIINKKRVGDFLYYSIIILCFVGKVIDDLFCENLWWPKISLIIFLICRSFLIILGIMAIKNMCKNKILNTVLQITSFFIIP